MVAGCSRELTVEAGGGGVRYEQQLQDRRADEWDKEEHNHARTQAAQRTKPPPLALSPMATTARPPHPCYDALLLGEAPLPTWLAPGSMASWSWQ
jgi:hypothetical protein